MNHMSNLLVLCVALCSIGWVWCRDLQPSLVITMMCRDEEVNFKANLAAWTPIADYFVFLIDNRTTDNSVATISSILTAAQKDYQIVMYDFVGFGQGRTLSLETAWKHYPHASHVLIADPDWAPDTSTMDINELDDSADVFRFTAYDRNGITRRRMDWLLKQREGLAMKYHLHEVLAIGMYTAKNINWVVHEIEKPGSWHTTVGHTNSFSAKRYEFDLDLLYKDLAMYGHDPHAHYYLGISHDAFAMRTSEQLGSQHPDVQYHASKAIEFLELRATTLYDDEFVDQRWAVMLQLGSAYAYLKRNDLKAIYWLSMCRDYNPRQSECALNLIVLYVRLGQIEPALKELYSVLRQDPEERAMVEYLNHWECKVPATAVQLLSIKARAAGLSSEEAKFFFLMWRMARRERCHPEPIEVDQELASVLNNAVGGPRHMNHFQTQLDFCADGTVQQYILRSEYNTHPCDAVRQAQFFAKHCAMYSADLTPAYEEYQVGGPSKQFIGTALLSDIIHHAYQGRRGDFLGRGDVLRFLFAEHFNPLMVQNLVGQLQTRAIWNVEVVVVTTNAAVVQSIQHSLHQCQAQVTKAYASKVSYFHGNAGGYLSQHPDKKFAYIEYNGGISKAAHLSEDLTFLNQLLTDDGVIGLTYFTDNHLTNRIHSIVDARNVVANIPFSLEATRLVHAFLDQHKLGAFKSDQELVTHLGGETDLPFHVMYKTSELLPRVQWRTYSQQEATDLVAAAGFRVASWVPSAYAHPFEEIDHYAVRKFRDTGISEEEFVREIMPTFRYSAYLTKAAAPAHLHGRLKLTERHFRDAGFATTLASKITVIDRMNYLSSSFQGLEALAQQRQSTSIEFAHHSLDTRFGFIVSPVIAPCLPHLSSRPTLQALHEMNKQFALREKMAFNEPEAVQLLLALVEYLEKLNIITFESTDLPASWAQDLDTVKNRKNLPDLKSVDNKLSESSQGPGAPQAREFGGLKITTRSRNKDTVPEKETRTHAESVVTTQENAVTSGTKIAWQKETNFLRLMETGISRAQAEQLLVSEEERFQALSKPPSAQKEDLHTAGVVDVLKAYTKQIEERVAQ